MKEQDKFNPGDVVQLQSGGELLTVIKKQQFDLRRPDEWGYLCCWISDDGTYRDHLFHAAVLKKY